MDPLLLRVLIGVAGLFLLLAGARLWKVAVLGPGIVLGALAGARIAAFFALEPLPLLILAAAGALTGALLSAVIERAALILAGLLAGLGAVDLARSLVDVPVWAWPLGAVVGAAIFPAIWRAALIPLTAWVGAVCIAHATGLGWGVVPLAAIGVGVQIATRDKPDEE